MDGQDRAARAVSLNLLIMRGGHLLEPIGEFHLADDGDTVPAVELSGDPGLLEEGNLEHAGLIKEKYLGDRHAALGSGPIGDGVDGVPAVELSGDPGLLEEGNLEHAGLIKEKYLGDRHAALGSGPIGDGVDGPHDGGNLAQGRGLHGSRMGEVQIAKRDMEKEVPHTLDAEPAEGLLP